MGSVSLQKADDEGSHLGEFSYRGVYRSATVPPCELDKEHLIRLFEDLEEKGREGLEHHLTDTVIPADADPTEVEGWHGRVRRTYALAMMIFGEHGEQIAVSSLDALQSQRFPDRVVEVIYDSSLILKNLLNVEPANRFRVTLDFTEPPGFDQYDPSSAPTPNRSQFEIKGTNATWVSGVNEYLLRFFRARGTKREWLHSHDTYNGYYWLFALPASLWVVYRVSERFEEFFSQLHGALTGAIYIYLFLVVFLAARGMVYGCRR